MTTRIYKGFIITHLHGTSTFKIYLDDVLIAAKNTLADAKRYINSLI